MRKSPIRRTAGLRRRNPKRRVSEWARAYGSRERVGFVRGLACVAMRAGDCAGPIEVAHTRTGGIGRKADARWTVPCCKRHHAALHTIGRETFETTYAVNLEVEATDVERRWQAHVSVTP